MKTHENENGTGKGKPTNGTPEKATNHSSWPSVRNRNAALPAAMARQDSNASSRDVQATSHVEEMDSIGEQILGEISQASLDPDFDAAAHWKVASVEACSSASFEQAFR